MDRGVVPPQLAIAILLTLVVWTSVPGARAITSGWGYATTIESYAAEAYGPKVVMDDTGNSIAVWQYWYPPYSFADVVANRYVVGVGWGVPEILGFGRPGLLALAGDSTGNATTLWVQSTSEPPPAVDVLFARRYVVGRGWASPEPIAMGNFSELATPKVGLDVFGGGIAVWLASNQTRYQVWGNQYTLGQGWGTPAMIATGDTSASLREVAVDPTGNAIASWSEPNRIWASRLTVGAGWGTPQQISEIGGIGGWGPPSVAGNAAGDVIAVWSQEHTTLCCGTRFSIWSSRFAVANGWGIPTVIETDVSGDAGNPVVASDPSGNAIAMWYYANGGFRVRANRYVVGSGWGVPTTLMSRTFWPGPASTPDVAVDAAGNAIALWTAPEASLPYGDKVWSARYSVGSGWETPTRIETNLGYAGFPDVSVNSHGDATAVWSQESGRWFKIWANRYLVPDTTPPLLVLTSPPDGMTTSDPTVLVSGSTEPGALLTVNALVVDVASDGFFSTEIALHEGSNVIVVGAADPSGNRASAVVTVTYTNPATSLEENLRDVLEQLNQTTVELESIRGTVVIFVGVVAGLSAAVVGMIAWQVSVYRRQTKRSSANLRPPHGGPDR